jgi:hypothetical protein
MPLRLRRIERDLLSRAGQRRGRDGAAPFTAARLLALGRKWICDPDKMDAVKITVFAYRKTLNAAMSTFSQFGVPSVEVTKTDIAFLLEDIGQLVVGHQDRNLLRLIDFNLGLLNHSIRHLRFDETMQLLEDPASAQDACWLLNHRDHLYGCKTTIKIEDLPWSVPVAEWDVVPCKAFRRAGHAIIREGEWKALTLADFWHRYCAHLHGGDENLLRFWKSQLRLAERRAEIVGRETAQDAFEEADHVDVEDLDI